MELLYQQHFGFNQAPFNITPDPGFLYLSASHREGLAQLTYGIKARKGFVVLTGEVGTGKTTLIHTLLNELNGNTHTALIFSAINNPLDLLRYVCEEFGLTEPLQPRIDTHEHLVLLNNFLLEKYRGGENCALIIDEAQNLSAEVLESIRLLSNFETVNDKLLQILLVGQPELAIRLNSQELRQLKQRVTLRHHLRALSSSECHEYISNRLRIAGGDPAIFTSKALEAMYAHSGGIPRVINVLADNALLTGYALGKKQLDDSIIREIAEDLSLRVTAVAQPLRAAPLLRSNGAASTTDHAQMTEAPRRKVAQPEQPPTIVSSLATVGGADYKASARCFDAINAELLEAMGPMAAIVLRDHMRRLGQPIDLFPKEKLAKLIEAVSQEILDPSMRQRFYNGAYQRIRQL
jgi:general secretion pathway protein A